MHTALLLGAFGVLLAFSALFSRALERLGIPVVLLFWCLECWRARRASAVSRSRITGCLSHGHGGAVLILLDGGLSPAWTLSAAARAGGILATVGVVGTAALVAGGGYLFGLAWPAAALLGAIVSSTDVATVFAVLRGGRLNLAPRVATTLEVESGANDPMAVILTTMVTDWIMGGPLHLWSVVLHVPLQLGIGLLVGLAVGWLTRVCCCAPGCRHPGSCRC
jgi:cell volume regulation protein A